MRNLFFLLGALIYCQNIYAQHVVLNIPKKYQLQSKWCWAACAEMLDSYHKNGTGYYSQCDIVKTFLNRRNPLVQGIFPYASNRTLDVCCTTCVCSAPFDVDANILMDYVGPIADFMGLTYHTLLVDLGYYSTIDQTINSAGGTDDIVREINKCTPLILGYGHKSGGSHIVLVKGYDFTSATEKMLVVNDPLNPGCSTCTLEMANLLALENKDCITKVQYFLSGIYRKDFSPCEKCGDYISNPFAIPPGVFRTTSNTTAEGETFAEILKKLEPQKSLKIPISYINFNSINNRIFNFDRVVDVKRDTDYYYFNSDRRYTLTKQNLEGESVVTMLKTCGYPLKYTIYPKGTKDSINIDLLKGDFQFEIIRLPGPFHFDFYKFTGHDGKSYIVPSMDNNGIFISKEPLKAFHEYNPKCLLKKVNKMIELEYGFKDIGVTPSKTVNASNKK